MAKINEVIKALEYCKDINRSCVNCFYREQCSKTGIKEDALGLLKIYREAVHNAAEFIKVQPEIVQCKDCKHGYTLTDSAYVTCGRRFHDGQKHEAYWFCADGVAKDINVPNKEGVKLE